MKKLMRIFTTFAISGALLISTTAVGAAADNGLGYKNLPEKNAEYWEEVNPLKEECNSYIQSIQLQPRVGGHKKLTVPLKKQTTSYYCGPASVQMVLSHHGINKTQSTIASKIGTTEAGSDIIPMKTYLNSLVGKGTYTHVNVDDLEFSSGLVASIDKGKPLICMIQTSELNYYKGHRSGHYVVVKGYDWDMKEGYSKLTLNDPNNNSNYYGVHTCTWKEMDKALRAANGWYIMGK